MGAQALSRARLPARRVHGDVRHPLQAKTIMLLLDRTASTTGGGDCMARTQQAQRIGDEPTAHRRLRAATEIEPAGSIAGLGGQSRAGVSSADEVTDEPLRRAATGRELLSDRACRGRRTRSASR